MKTVRLFFAVTLSTLALTHAQAELKWEQTSLELHPALGEKQAIGHFKYLNAGKTPIRIKSAKSSCGCTVAQSQTEPVAPGDKGEITATFTIGDRTGTQLKNITVETDDPAQAVTVLTLKTVIPEMLTISPTLVYWTAGEEVKPKTINVKASKDFPAKNLAVSSTNPEFLVKVESPAAGEWKVAVEPKQTDHGMSTRINIQSDLPKESPKTFYANASVTAAPAPAVH